MQPPLPLIGRRLNRTLHGRTRYRKQDVPGHNCYRGYNTPGWGDGIDWFAAEGTTVRAIEDCVQERHSGDATKKEVVYLRGEHTVAVYAHINARYGGTGHQFKAGEPVGRVRGDLSDPHLHFELELDGEPVCGKTPASMHGKLLCVLYQPHVIVRGDFCGDVGCCLHDGKLYVTPRPFAAALGFSSWRDGSTLCLSGKQTFNLPLTELDEPGVWWVRATGILQPAGLAYTWKNNALFVH